jgi:DNA-binding beta-propeller fold protein YncE/tetratricopeptide (TPR) repeat protein
MRQSIKSNYLSIKSLNFFITLFFFLGTSAFSAYQFESSFGKNMNGAQFVTVAPDGNIWVAAYSEHNVRVFLPDGQEASFSPIVSGTDHLGNSVKLENPSGIAITHQGIVYITDDALISPKRIYRYNQATGNPLPGIPVRYSLGDIAVTSSDNLLVIEKIGKTFHILDSEGKELEGSPVIIPGTRSMFRGIAVSSDGRNVYITAEEPGELLQFQGTIQNNRAQYQFVGPLATNLSRPGAVELDQSGRIYVTETGADRIQIYDASGKLESELAGGTPVFRSPRGIGFAPDGSAIYIAQFTTAPLQKWSSGVTPSTPAVSVSVSYRVQVGVLSAEVQANILKTQLEMLGYSGINIVSDGQSHRVQLGNFNSVEAATNLAQDINNRLVSPDFNGCLIVDSNLATVKSVPISAITVAQPTAPSATGGANYWIQIGAYRVESNANAVKKALEKIGYTNSVISKEQNYLKVRLGPFPEITTAQKVVTTLKDPQKGLVFPGLTGDFWIFAGGAGGAPPPAIIRQVYRVFIASFPDQKDALILKAKLETRGFWPVFVEAEEPLYNVLIGAYITEAEATGLIPKLKQEGYVDIRIVRAGEVRPQIAMTSQEEEQKKKEATSIQDRAEEFYAKKQYDQAILQLERLLQLQTDNTKAIQRLQQAQERLSEEQRLSLDEKKRKDAEEEAKRRQVDALNAKAMSLWEQGNYVAAVNTWSDVLQIDSRDPRATLYIALSKDRLAPLPTEKKVELEAKAKKSEETDKIYKDGRELYASGLAQNDVNLINQAIEKWNRVLRDNPNHVEAKEAIANANIKLDDIAKSQKQKKLNLAIYIGIGILVIAGLVFVVPVLIRKVKSIERKPKPVKSSVTTPVPAPAPEKTAAAAPVAAKSKKGFSLFGGKKAKKALAAEQEAKLKEAQEASARQKAAQKQEDYEKWYQKGLEELEGGKFEEAIASFLQAGSIDPNNPDPKRKAEFARKSLKTQQTEEREQKSKAPPPPPPKPEPTPEPIPMPTPTVPRIPEPEPEIVSPVKQTATAAPGEIIFEQNFDAESAGNRPAGWNGEFTFASIQVQNANTANKTGNALKFEKKDGSGSTHYRCRFPNTPAKFTVEFDLCCEKKNKYFLGIYIESDEDFRKAVHTVIHTPEDGSQALLRIQGESVPYQLGTWVHIKYEVDLSNAVVDGFFDGNKVASGARVPGTPESMNTISIRDNPATVAVLYIDNIKIY